MVININDQNKKDIGTFVNDFESLAMQTEQLLLDESFKVLDGTNRRKLDEFDAIVPVIVANFLEQGRQFVQNIVPTVYTDGIRKADTLLRRNGETVINKPDYVQIHQETMQAQAQTMFDNVRKSAETIQSNSNNLSRQLRRQLNLREQKVLTPALLKEGNDILKKNLEARGITGLVDKSGKVWNISRYSKMLSQTEVIRTYREALFTRLIENNEDLVRIVHLNYHPECPLCTPWSGKIISLTGKTKGYPTRAQAEASGLFHPQCDHVEYDVKDTKVTKNPVIKLNKEGINFAQRNGINPQELEGNINKGA